MLWGFLLFDFLNAIQLGGWNSNSTIISNGWQTNGKNYWTNSKSKLCNAPQYTTKATNILLQITMGVFCYLVFVSFLFTFEEKYLLSQLVNLIEKHPPNVRIYCGHTHSLWTKFSTAAKNVQIVFAAYRLVSHTSKWFERGKQGATHSSTHTHERVGWITLGRTVAVIGTLCHIMEISSPLVRALRFSSAWLKHNSISVWPLCNHSLFFNTLLFSFFCFFFALCYSVAIVRSSVRLFTISLAA